MEIQRHAEGDEYTVGKAKPGPRPRLIAHAADHAAAKLKAFDQDADMPTSAASMVATRDISM